MEPAQNSLSPITHREYPAVDIIKFLCALLVVTIHMPPFSSFSGAVAENWNHDIVLYLAQIAVPFYFAASGFFLFGKIDLQQVDYSLFKKFVFKNLRLMGIWGVILVVGGNGHLWFMKTLVSGALLLALFLRLKMSMKQMTVFAVVSYIIGLLGSTYFGMLAPLQGNEVFDNLFRMFEYLFSGPRNAFFMGFPFMLLGGWVCKSHRKLPPIPAFLGFLASMLLLFQETRLLRHLDWLRHYSVYVCLPFAIYFLLSFATSVSMKNRSIYPKLRVVGIVVYFSHKLMIFGFKAVFYLLQLLFGVSVSNSLAHCLLTMAASTAFGFVLERLSHTKKFGFVHYLYS